MKENKLHSIEISRSQWKLIVWSPIILGTIIFSFFGSSFFIPAEHLRYTILVWLGGILVGAGFGLIYSRVFKIRGIDK
jgi:hypothetical protein